MKKKLLFYIKIVIVLIGFIYTSVSLVSFFEKKFREGIIIQATSTPFIFSSFATSTPILDGYFLNN